MKKGLAFVLALLTLGSLAWAQSTVQIGPDGKSLVFIYDNPDATEANIAGTFNSWSPTATKMTKRADKKFEFVLRNLGENDEVKFKFLADGEWDQDSSKAAPASADDGFGGLNGVVSIALLKAAATGAPVATATGLKFGIFSSNRIVYTMPENNSAWAHQASLKSKTYLKFNGNLLPDMPAFMEVQFTQGDVLLYKMDDKEPIKGDKIGDLFFNPFYPLNDGGSQPKFGHLRIGVNTPFVNVTSYSWYAKTTMSNDYYFELYRELDAWNGAVEMTKTLDLASDAKLTWFLALSKRPNWSGDTVTAFNTTAINRGQILRGLQSFVTLQTAGYSFQLMYNNREVNANAVRYYLGNLNHQIALGAKGEVIKGLSFQTQFFANFLNPKGDELTGSPIWYIRYSDAKFQDHVGFGLSTNLALGMFGGKFNIQYAGDWAELGYFYGRNDEEKANAVYPGYITLKINPWVAPIEGLKVGTDNQIGLDNAFEKIADGGNPFYLTNKVYANYSNLGLGLYVTNGFFAASDTKSVLFPITEVGIKFDLGALNLPAPVAPEFYLAYIRNLSLNPNYDVIVDTTALHFIADTKLDGIGLENMGVALGLIYRMDGEQLVNEKSKIGISGGFRWLIRDLRNADFFVNYGWKAWLFDDDDKSDRKLKDYRFDYTDDLGSDNGRLAIGIKWDF